MQTSGFEQKSGQQSEFLESILICDKCGEPIFGSKAELHKCGEFSRLIEDMKEFVKKYGDKFKPDLIRLQKLQEEANKKYTGRKSMEISQEDLDAFQIIKKYLEGEEKEKAKNKIIIEINKKSGLITIRGKKGEVFSELSKKITEKIEEWGLDVEIEETKEA